MRIQNMILLLAAMSLSGPAMAQSVEYATRNVQPTHAVRFGSSPIRITITTDGVRQPLASARHNGRGHHRSHGSRRLGIRRGGHHTGYGGGHIYYGLHRTVVQACDEPSRSRTVYGRDRSEARTPSPRARAESAASDNVAQAAERRHLLRVQAMILAAERAAARKTAGAGADDR